MMLLLSKNQFIRLKGKIFGGCGKLVSFYRFAHSPFSVLKNRFSAAVYFSGNQLLLGMYELIRTASSATLSVCR